MKMFVVLALAACASAEPEADPALLYTSAHSPLLSAFNTYNTLPTTYSHGVAAPLSYKAVATPAVYKAVATPAVYKAVATPAVYKAVATPAVTYKAAINPVVYAQPQVASHTVTNYHSPTHYTAVSNGVYGPKYIAKNGPVQHIVKREAEAEAFSVYNTLPLTYNTAVHHAVATPAVYNTAVHHAVATPAVYNTAVHHAVARPAVYNTAYNHVVAAPSIYKAAPHAVALTPYGATHSSNVGVCTNNLGAVVPC